MSAGVAVTEHLNRAVAAHRAGRLAEAERDCRRALALAPGDLQALNARGAILQELKRPAEALASLERARLGAPLHPELLFNRGNALADLGEAERAIAAYDAVLRLSPAHLAARWNRGNVLAASGRLDAAVAAYRQILAVAPAHAEVMNNLGNASKDLGRAEEALACYGRVLAVTAGHAAALGNRASLLRLLGRHAEAIPVLERLLALDPRYPDAAGNLLQSKLHCCDWTDLDRRTAELTAAIRAGRRASTPFAFFAITRSEEDQARCAESYCRELYPAAPAWNGRAHAHERIRVAYLSADFRDHPIAHLLAGLFERHDQARFETIALSLGPPGADPMRRRLERAFSRFIDVARRSDRDIAQLLRGLEIDIAVDLMGHTHGTRLGVFALRPAPVSVNFYCPTGAAFIDYLIGDAVALPPESHRFHRERIVTLPDTLLATDRTRPIAGPTPARPELGLPEDAFVFCSFNNSYKLNPPMFDIWMRLLRRIPRSVLWLQQINQAATAALRREAAARGVDPARLVFAPRLASPEEHLARYRRADLFLDTLPFNAQTTAADALWAGLPVLTCLGTTFVGRIAASLLHAVGLPELVAGSLDEYERRAAGLAGNRAELEAIRGRLAAHRDSWPLFDTDRYRRHVERAYETMIERSRHGLPPASFAVSA
jgi:predicted O-linked N-acetylglucosamine transferase (SPINDLY family)